MDFKLKRLHDYSNDALLQELRRVAHAVPIEHLTIKLFKEHGRVSASTIQKRFGGWREALEAAELSDRYGGPSITDKMRIQPGRLFSRQDVLTELRRVATELGRSEITVEDIRSHASISLRTVKSHFGTWRLAIEAAGLELRNTAIRYSDEECFENLLRVWTHYGRQPTSHEMSVPPSTVPSPAYQKRWGTWLKALEAFVERVNQDSPEPETIPRDSQASKPTKSRADDGKISLRLRYLTLVRGGFKCGLCGSSPASDPNCHLHVDHIRPRSKDGPTTLENLRTLCQHCNLGKSNLTIEDDAR